MLLGCGCNISFCDERSSLTLLSSWSWLLNALHLRLIGGLPERDSRSFVGL